jgi:hypothetical protein
MIAEPLHLGPLFNHTLRGGRGAQTTEISLTQLDVN